MPAGVGKSVGSGAKTKGSTIRRQKGLGENAEKGRRNTKAKCQEESGQQEQSENGEPWEDARKKDTRRTGKGEETSKYELQLKPCQVESRPSLTITETASHEIRSHI